MLSPPHTLLTHQPSCKFCLLIGPESQVELRVGSCFLIGWTSCQSLCWVPLGWAVRLRVPLGAQLDLVSPMTEKSGHPQVVSEILWGEWAFLYRKSASVQVKLWS